MRNRHLIATVGLFGLLAVLPGFSVLLDQPYFLIVGTKILIYGIAAISLDLLLGYGGMVSFGHAAFLGVGAYVVGISSFHAQSLKIYDFGVGREALIVWPLAILASAFFAALIGSLSLRTKGVQFIMITLAFAQMLFFMTVSLEVYGGDDGLGLSGRNQIVGLSLDNDMVFYYVCFCSLGSFFYFCQKLITSRFGRIIQGIRQNPLRMETLGYPIYRYQLICFVIAGAGAGLAGVLAANQTTFVSPDLLHWSKSGEIMIMVILGGMGTLLGPILGGAVLIGFEEGLARYTSHWMIFLGTLLIVMVLMLRRGLYGLFVRGHSE
ncbi:MAG: branched-chain amino acid ABC transporter permease [Alphaproteobacteria bacterium]